MKPTLSVVSICFNNLPDLVATCQSVDEQTVTPEEHLIIDGSTSKEIVEWLAQNPQPSCRRWIHERDAGISDAFNKGIVNAKNDIIHLLNSGDRYASKAAIETVLSHFLTDDKLMWLHSKYIQHRGGMDVVSGVAFDKHKLWKGMRTVAHPTMIIKKELYEKYGLYKTGYQIAMDYDMLVRIRDERSVFIPYPLVYFAPGGASATQFKKGMEEVRKIYRTHIGFSTKMALWQWRQKALHYFMKTRLGKKWFRWKNEKA